MDQIGEYQKLQPKRYPPRLLRETPEGNFWKRFKQPVVNQLIGTISHISYCEEEPHNFAVTASTRIMVYDGNTLQMKRQFTRFTDKAYSGVLRQDGKLLAAGGEAALVQIFDANSRSLLRQFKGHARPVHCVRFSPDKLSLLSASDDATVRLWDVTSGEQKLRITGHEDYVRTAAVSASSGDLWATGSYDHTVRFWDVRSGQCTMALNHGAPVEDVTYLPTGTLAVSVGGNYLCVWDLMAGGRLLKKVSNHQKTITCVRVAPAAGSSINPAPRLMTASLDGHVKVYDLDDFKVTHASRYPSPITALGIAPDATTMAVGMADGVLCARKHTKGGARAALADEAGAERADSGQRAGGSGRPRRALNAGNFRFFIRGQNERAAESDLRVMMRKKANLQAYDRLLRRFRHREALDAALDTRRPEIVAAVIDELTARSALTGALGGRDAEGLEPLLAFLCKYIADPRHAHQLTAVAHRVLDIYAPELGTSPEVDAKFRLLREKVMLEVQLQENLAELQGLLEPIISISLGAHSMSVPMH